MAARSSDADRRFCGINSTGSRKRGYHLGDLDLVSIPDLARALSEMHRVLKPRGQLLFVEHGLSPDENVRKWQHRLTPLWKRFAGGCHLDRPIAELVEGAGFRMKGLQTGYMQGPKPMAFMYEGVATPL